MFKKVILFLILNFAALYIGAIYTNPGVSSDWYQNLNQAPWTPPGWVFGVAWTTIMICFAFYMAYLFEASGSKRKIIALFTIQWILNVSWNPIFFYLRQSGVGLVLITLLSGLIIFLFFKYWKIIQLKSLFILPYLIWLLIATSLNGYVYFNN